MPSSLPDTAAAFEALLEPVLGGAYGMACNLSRNAADAQDLVQEAAFRALRGFGSFVAGTNFKAWFYRILTNVFLERRRREKRRPTVELDEAQDLRLFRESAAIGLHARTEDPAAVVMEHVTGEEVRAALSELPEAYAAVACLYFCEEMSYPMIAEVLEIPVGTVRSRLHRARGLLQSALWQCAVDAGIADTPGAAR